MLTRVVNVICTLTTSYPKVSLKNTPDSKSPTHVQGRFKELFENPYVPHGCTLQDYLAGVLGGLHPPGWGVGVKTPTKNRYHLPAST